jgi:hypothetical protein
MAPGRGGDRARSVPGTCASLPEVTGSSGLFLGGVYHGVYLPQSRTMGSWHAKERSRASKPNGAQLNGRDDTKREHISSDLA